MGAKARGPAVLIDRLSKAYGKKVALADLSLSVPPGCVFGFLGPNGAGKSTTVNLLCTLLRPSAGRAIVNGFDTQTQPAGVRRSIGLLPEQVPYYPSLTGWEDLEFFGRVYGLSKGERRERSVELFSLVGLSREAHRPVRTFSKGMRQRLGLARALMHNPKVLFLDEPTSGLDPLGREAILDVIRTASEEGATVFLTSHNLAEVESVCHRVAFLKRGFLRAVAPLDGTGRATFVEAKPKGQEVVSQLREALSRRGVGSVVATGGLLRVFVDSARQADDVKLLLENEGATQSIGVRTASLSEFYHDLAREARFEEVTRA